MKNKLYIVGAGGFGREVYQWLQDERRLLQDYEFVGFLDDDLAALSGLDLGHSVVAPLKGFPLGAHDFFICGIGSVEWKRRLCQPMLHQGARFLSLVHPTALIGRGVTLGDGVVVCPRVTLTCDVRVGAMSMINCHSSAGHDVVIGDWCTIGAHCDLTGGTSLGQGVFLGSGVRVIPSKTIGSSSTVGAGSVVIRNVAPETRVFGNPARVF
jgi:sugar O-acyltransferase (sialic acid O-acetyltransferase NeuD family)